MNLQKLQGYRTIAVNILTIAVVALTSLTGSVTDAGTLQVLVYALALSNIALRFLTNSPVGKSPPVVVTASGESKEISAAAAEKVVNAPGDGV